jgi:transcriptional regulator with XRE-family HTH domain
MLDRLSANLAHNLRRLREARAMTQQELSERSGVPRPTLAHLESGSANPTLSVLARVAQTLGVAMEELVQAPNASLTLNRAESLESSERDGAQVRRLLPSGTTSAIAFERIELSVRAEHSRGLGRNLDLCYLACERGEVEVVTGDERAILKSGDVAVVARGAAHSCLNRGRGSAVVYSVRTVATA